MNFFILTFIIILLMSFIFQKSKYLFAIGSILNIILIGGYNGNGDLDNYIFRYNNKIITDGYIESMYDRLAMVFSDMGVKFEVFHFILSATSIIMMAYVIYKLSKRPAFAMALFSGYSIIEYALQLKAMCAAAIISVAIYYYYNNIYKKEHCLKNKIIYVILIILASGFHFISPFFFLLFLVDIINQKNLKYMIVLLCLSVVVLAPTIVKIMSVYIPNLSYYMNMKRELLSTIGFCLWQILSVIIVKKIKSHNSTDKTEEDKKFDSFVLNGSWIVLLIIPFYTITLVINRIVKIWSAFFYIQASNIQSKKNYLSLEKSSMVAFSVGSFIMFYLILLDTSGQTYNVLFDIIKNNVFWKG